MNFPVLTLLLFTPIGGSLLLFLSPKEKLNRLRGIALSSGILTLLLSLYLYANYDPHGPPWQFEVFTDWIPSFRIGYHLGVDGISLPLVLLSGILNLAAIPASFGIKERVKEYFILLLLVEAGIMGCFITLDLFLFLLFYELAGIPIYFLIGMWGSDGRQASRSWVTKREFSALKLTLYLQLGGVLILIGFLALYLFAVKAGLPHPTFDFVELLQGNFGKFALFSRVIFGLLFAAFGIEAGLFPFHTWLPDGHSAAPTAVSMLLAGVLLKMGAYGMIRFACGLLPEGGKFCLPFFAVLAVINILYGAWCALKQYDLKYVIAYSSVSHMGIVFLGLSSGTLAGWSGALFQMVSHGVITALLFALAGFLYEKTHTRDVRKMGGLAPKAPFLATAFVLGGLAGLGLPGTSGFVGEFLTFLGTYGTRKILVVLGVFGLVLSALYILLTVKKVFFGSSHGPEQEMPSSVAWWERVPVIGCIAVIFFLGIMPRALLEISSSSLAPIVRSLASCMGTPPGMSPCRAGMSQAMSPAQRVSKQLLLAGTSPGVSPR